MTICGLKLRMIAGTLNISEVSVFTILHESLGMHKLFSKWVPRLLTPDQKQQRVQNSERCLELFKRQLSEQQLVKAVQSDQKLNSGLARLCYPYFGTRMLFCLSTILGKVKPLTVTITWHYWID